MFLLLSTAFEQYVLVPVPMSTLLSGETAVKTNVQPTKVLERAFMYVLYVLGAVGHNHVQGNAPYPVSRQAVPLQHLKLTVVPLQMAQLRLTPHMSCRQGFRLSHPKTASHLPPGSTHQGVTWHQGNSQPPHQMPGLMLTHRWPAGHPQFQHLAPVQHSPLPCQQVLQLDDISCS